ncbi:hypothetical protein J5N97_019104 [Dioscorea zingiberensis]|uniref:Pentatricopeptide repeat-containing protein n=1 Tax=Dioscorea zingiberensis TaxID=325984 RepID=A0A9D5HCD2_9LILI|nr:hypothetical protein J5N97_019104 [Dioscorea zingiberensis]
MASHEVQHLRQPPPTPPSSTTASSTVNTLIRSHARDGDLHTAISLFHGMPSLRLAPSVFSFNSLFRHRGHTITASKLYAEMSRVHVTPMSTLNTLEKGLDETDAPRRIVSPSNYNLTRPKFLYTSLSTSTQPTLHAIWQQTVHLLSSGSLIVFSTTVTTLAYLAASAFAPSAVSGAVNILRLHPNTSVVSEIISPGGVWFTAVKRFRGGAALLAPNAWRILESTVKQDVAKRTL